MDAVLTRLGELGPWSYAIVGVLAFLEASAFVGLIAPGETAVVFAGFLRAFAPFVAGMSGMPYGRFVLYNVSGAVLWAVGFTVLGYVAGANWQEIQRWMTWIGAGVAVVVLVVIVVHWRRLQRAPA